MADFTKRIIFIILYWISEIRLDCSSENIGYNDLLLHHILFADISLRLLQWGICKEEEECCGPNKCCPKSVNTFYIIAWILAGLLVVAISCGSLLRDRKVLCRFFKHRSEKIS